MNNLLPPVENRARILEHKSRPDHLVDWHGVFHSVYIYIYIYIARQGVENIAKRRPAGRKQETVAHRTQSHSKCAVSHTLAPPVLLLRLAMSKQDASDGGIPAAEAPAKRPPLNKYALACAILASMNSILLGYGTHAALKWDIEAIQSGS
jgi:hypothetical protein